MRFHLPTFKATPLVVLLACCLGMAWAGAIPETRSRHRPRSPTPSTEGGEARPDSAHGKRTDTPPEVAIAQSQQRALLKNGRRIADIPAGLAHQIQDNGTVVQQQQQQQQRVVKRSSCEIREEVVRYHRGACVTIGGMDFCETDLFLDLNNADCF